MIVLFSMIGLDAFMVDGVPVIGKISEIKEFFLGYKLLLVTIGNNVLRERLNKEAAAIGYNFPNILHCSAYISPHAIVSTGCVILNNAVIQNNAKKGNGCILNPGVEAHYDSTIGSVCLVYTNSGIRSLTHVGDRVWIGLTATISMGAVVPGDTVVNDGVV